MPNILTPLADTNFRRFWVGGAVSVFGDHLTFIAMPWLVLKLTGDTLAMGAVIAVAALPRALLMLFGGVLSDRWSPRLVMLWSNVCRFLLILVLTLLTYSEDVTLTLILVIGFCFGVADAFLYPAASAMPPRLLPGEQLAAGNGLLQGTFQLNVVLGPLVGGLLIAGLGDAPAAQTQGADGLTDRVALTVVFALDAMTFLISIWALATLRERFLPQVAVQGSLLDNIKDGLLWAWRDLSIRTLMLLMAGLSLVFRGPFMVGVPALANSHLEQGAAAYGVIISALGIGSVIGAVMAGMLKPLATHWIGKLLLVDFFVFGALLIMMSQVHNLYLISGVVLVAGVLDGYLIVFLTTWVQQHVPVERMGRVMSVLMFVGQGLFPVSSAAAGAMAGWDLISMLMLGGGLAMIMALAGFASRTVRRFGIS